MNAVCLHFYAREGERHQHHLIHDYLLELAKNIGASGATVLRASAGFGRHGWHESTFFELSGTLPVVVEMVLPDDLAQKILAECSAQHLKLFYTLAPVIMGVTGEA